MSRLRFISNKSIICLYSLVTIFTCIASTAQKVQEHSYSIIKNIDLSNHIDTKTHWEFVIAQADDLAKWKTEIANGFIDEELDNTDRPLRYQFIQSFNKPNSIFEWPQIESNNPSFSYQEYINTIFIPSRLKHKSYIGFVLIAYNESYRLGEAYKGLYCLSAWNYNSDTDRFEKMLDPLTYSDQGEIKLISHHDNTFIVLADFIWGANEGRYQPHRYRMHIYRINNKCKMKLINQYTTKTKYQSLDDTDTIDVISHESTNIKKFFK